MATGSRVRQAGGTVERAGRLRWRRLLMHCAFPALLSLVAGCGGPGLREERLPAEPSYALPPATEGLLASLATDVFQHHGDDHSGMMILDTSIDGLMWRLALIDSAVSSLDIQTYLWYPDASGLLILERAILAAQRGVRVRLLVDDLILNGHDQIIANLDAQPNIEFRMFNPWERRGSLAARAVEMIAEMERLNTRMHDKLIIADGNAAVIGGRNIGDHYFGLHESYNFHDTDVLGFGHIARQANDMFDSFWNDPIVVSAANLTTDPDPEIAQQQWRRIQASSRESPVLAAFPRQPIDWTDELRTLYEERLRFGTSQLVYDEFATALLDHDMLGSMFSFFDLAERELLIFNAYVIPGSPAIEFIEGLTARGVEVVVLTNSLESHDVPAVNSHYGPWRDDLLEAGVSLYEMRGDAAIQSLVDVPPVESRFVGLHSKAAVVDRRYAFVGSMNLDPRSANINTEMGAIIDSHELAEDLAAIIERNIQPENAWRVMLDQEGELYWENSDRVVYSQPARSSLQRVMNTILKIVPKEQN